MSGVDRLPYKTATVLDQALLDACHDNLTIELRAIVEAETPEVVASYTNPSGNMVQVTSAVHEYLVGEYVEIASADDAGLVGSFEVTARTPTTFTFNKGSPVSPGSGALTFIERIFASDRNCMVLFGGVGYFYEALTVFPVIVRTLGEWLVPELQFATCTLEISNVDGRFNKYLPGGAAYDTFVNRALSVAVGLLELGSTYETIFEGTITEAAGVQRSTKALRFVARDRNARYDVKFPGAAITAAAFPNVEDQVAGKILPVIYGDWTVEFAPDPSPVPTFVANGADVNILGGPRLNVVALVSENDNTLFDSATVYLRRGQTDYLAPATEIVNVSAGKNRFEVKQNTAALWLADSAGLPVPYLFEANDTFFCRVKGKDLGAYDDNIVAQARDILETYGTVPSILFHANWDSFRDKAAPAQSAISTIKSRIWLQEPQGAVVYALSLLEQVRLEAFFDRDGMLKINSLHFEDWPAAPTHTIRNWDVEEGSLRLSIDEKNNFNRARGTFNRLPGAGEAARATRVHRNSAAITQVKKEISKQIDFPNLYVEQDVTYQIIEILRLASSTIEIADCALTWRSIKKDPGDFVLLNIVIGSVVYEDVPAMLRDVGYDPAGFKLPVKAWPFAMCPYPGYDPGYYGTVGGYAAVITAE